MNDLKVFSHKELGGIRAFEKDGQPWFVGKDVTEVLGYSNSRDALEKRVDNEDKGVAICDTLGGKQNITIINESGLYSLILSSKLPKAKLFKHWVTSEVLPSIRRTGGYAAAGSETDFIIKSVTSTIMAQLPAIVSETVKVTLNMVLTGNEPSFKLPVPETKVQYPRRNAFPTKLSTFPREIVSQVDMMLELMLEQQSLNFKKIERFCRANGYPISSVAVKNYYDRNFVEEFGD